jgi:low affinity Fe/Cu permease
MAHRTLSSVFSQAAQWAACQCGRAHTFVLACVIIVVWGASGPVFGYSDTWQLIINTGTTIVTFLMVFLMQNTQNRDTAAIQLKLDELIRANGNARNAMLTLEDLTEDQLNRLKATFAQLAAMPPSAQSKLRDATADLEEAGAKVEQAQAEIEQAASRAQARREPDRIAAD